MDLSLCNQLQAFRPYMVFILITDGDTWGSGLYQQQIICTGTFSCRAERCDWPFHRPGHSSWVTDRWSMKSSVHGGLGCVSTSRQRSIIQIKKRKTSQQCRSIGFYWPDITDTLRSRDDSLSCSPANDQSLFRDLNKRTGVLCDTSTAHRHCSVNRPESWAHVLYLLTSLSAVKEH